jgi:kynurenine formamidase
VDKQRIRDYMATMRQLAASRRFGERDRLGCANLIDEDARRRGLAAVVNGTALSLARPLVPHSSPTGRPGMRLTPYFSHERSALGGLDHLELDCHGYRTTHVDALNHIGLDDTWYAGWPPEDTEALSMAVPARHGLITRGVVLDIPAVRDVEWVSVDEPVGPDDLERALARTGLHIEPGDAVLIYMGRDRYEAAGKDFAAENEAGTPVPGLGCDGGRWIADHPISMLVWDFLDAVRPGEPRLSVHWLIWAIGLLIVDNCDYSSAIPTLRERGRYAGLFTLAPLPIPGGTGSVVNPLLLI